MLAQKKNFWGFGDGQIQMFHIGWETITYVLNGKIGPLNRF